MRNTLGLIAAAVVLVLTADVPAAEVKTKEITFKSGGEEIKGFLAEPEGKGPFPAIVAIQEWWGLTDWIKDNAKHFASQGYVALAPDLYRGKVTDNPATAKKLINGMPQDRALRDLRAAVDTLASRGNVDRNRIGSIGWCMGGGLSLQLALADKRIQACAMCYGRVVTDPKRLESLHATVLGVFGTGDKGIPISSVRQFGKALKEAGKKSAGLHEYKAGHGFMRPGKNPSYVAGEAKAAWKVIDQFFAETLKGK